MPARCPDLLPVDDPLVAILFRLGLEPGEVAAGHRLAEQLAPCLLPGDDVTDVAVDLFLRAMHRDRRCRQQQSEPAGRRERTVFRDQFGDPVGVVPRQVLAERVSGSDGADQPARPSRFHHSATLRSGSQFSSSQVCSSSITSAMSRWWHGRSSDEQSWRGGCGTARARRRRPTRPGQSANRSSSPPDGGGLVGVFFGDERAVPVGLEHVGEFRTAGRHDATLHQDVHMIRLQLGEQTAVVRDREHTRVSGSLLRSSTRREQSRRASMSRPGVELVEDRDLRAAAPRAAGSRCASSRHRRGRRSAAGAGSVRRS